MPYGPVASEIIADLHVEAACGTCAGRSPAMRKITYAAIPASELQANHRIDEHRAPMCVVGVDFISHVERQERVKATETGLELRTAENGNQRRMLEIPLLGDAESGSESDVGMHLASDAALEIERHVVVACDYRLELQERIDSRCGKGACAQCQ